APYFVRFFDNHGMLSIDDRPTWRVVRGGSRTYVQAFLEEFSGTVRKATPIQSVHRYPDHVELRPVDAPPERFDAVFLATHSDTSLRLLADPRPSEREILGAIPYQRNEAVLHTDASLMPRRRRAWAAWNYHVGTETDRPVSVTYNMNILQGPEVDTQFLVTLNRSDEIADPAVIERFVYHHPVFTPAGVAAQRRIDEISGHDRTYYCGAYWGFGFHEDGVKSGIAAVERFAARQPVPAA
ncbi:MAG: FAD-dependent oxidoreductase, partial [Planctomycetes bacterium]|nr:FAD-dependent oxidoreductase [Planctomycetota bacterium]